MLCCCEEGRLGDSSGYKLAHVSDCSLILYHVQTWNFLNEWKYSQMYRSTYSSSKVTDFCH